MMHISGGLRPWAHRQTLVLLANRTAAAAAAAVTGKIIAKEWSSTRIWGAILPVVPPQRRRQRVELQGA